MLQKNFGGKKETRNVRSNNKRKGQRKKIRMAEERSKKDR